MAVVPFYISANSVQGFPFLYIFTNFCYLVFFFFIKAIRLWGDILLWFWFVFLWWLVMLSFFPYTNWTLVCLLWKNVYSGPLPILKLNYLISFAIELYEFLLCFLYLKSHFDNPTADCMLNSEKLKIFLLR